MERSSGPVLQLGRLKNNEVHLLYVLFGEDDFSRRQALENIKTVLNAGDLLSANTVALEGKHLTLAQLTSACDTIPFLAPQRLVVVEGLLERFQPRPKSDKPQDHPEPRQKTEKPFEPAALAEHIKIMPMTTILVLTDGKIDPSNPMLKALSPVATVKSFPILKGDNLRAWIGDRVTRGGGNISASAANLLADTAGDDLWTLSSEIDKLMLYAQGQTIEEKDVRSVVSHTRQASIFPLVDAVLEGRLTEAMRLLHSLLEEGSHPSYVLVMLTRQFRLALQAKELDSQGMPAPQIQGRIGLPSEYAFKKALAQGRKHSQRRLEAAYRQLLATDISIKTGRQDPELAIDLLVTDLCS